MTLPPLISVYMPTRNRAALVRRAAESVLAQTHAHLELLIVDDGSTDETPQVLAGLAARDARVRCFRHDSAQGAPRARNVAIDTARGTWLTGLDDDDCFAPDRLAALLQYWLLLESTGEPFSGLYTQDIYDDGRQRTVSCKRGTVGWQDLFEFNSVGNQLFTLTSRMRAVGGFDADMPAWQDLDLFVRILKRFGPARLLDAGLYTLSVDERPDRISRSRKARIVQAFERLSAKHPEASPHMRQQLFLQVFGRLYGHRPGWADARRFFLLGWDRRNATRFLGRMLARA